MNFKMKISQTYDQNLQFQMRRSSNVYFST